MNHLSSVFFGVNQPDFNRGIQCAIDNIPHQNGIFTGDNLFTFGRNLSFLEDTKFVDAWKSAAETSIEKAIVWRLHTVAWAAKSVIARGISGDFVECGCYRGTTAKVVVDYTEFYEQIDRRYYLYDLFEHDSSMPHHSMPDHGPDLYEWVTQRFSAVVNVKVIKGLIPDVLYQNCPERIAFLHVDLNNADAEISTLDYLFERVTAGGIVILDDYGWLAYRKQKLKEDPWFAEKGYRVLELPTGQGFLIK